MKTGRAARGILVAVSVFGVLGAAIAQEGAAAPPAPAAPAEEEQLSLPQMLERAKGFLPAMDRSAVAVRRQLGLAREQKDVVKALCLNDKLNQIDLAIRTATDRIGGLEAAVNANDVERSKHQYTVVLVLRDRVTTLVSEANQCIGEDVGFIGESNVTMEVDSDIPDTDPSDFPDYPITSDPPITSPPGTVSNQLPEPAP